MELEIATKKIMKILHITRDTRKTLKRGKQEKRRGQDKFDDVSTTIEFLPFNFYGKGYILLENIVWENVVYIITFLVMFFSVAGYLK